MPNNWYLKCCKLYSQAYKYGIRIPPPPWYITYQGNSRIGTNPGSSKEGHGSNLEFPKGNFSETFFFQSSKIVLFEVTLKKIKSFRLFEFKTQAK